jgi:hypothetical protein
MYRIHQISNKILDSNDPLNSAYYNGVDRLKMYKFKVQNKKVYHIELMYIKNFVFIKFYPSKYKNDPNKFKHVGMKLSISEIRGIFNTCSALVKEEIDRYGAEYNYAFIGQPYDKDDEKGRKSSKRYMTYTKQTTTDFFSDNILHFSDDELNFYAISRKEKNNFQNDLMSILNFLGENSKIIESICTRKVYDELKESINVE